MNTKPRNPVSKNKPQRKKAFGFVFAIALASTIAITSGCTSVSANLANTDSPESVISILDTADNIVAKKKAMSFGDQWTITADGAEVGVIRGEVIPVLGDTYSLFSNTGQLVSIEAENLQLVTRSAKLYDHESNPRGEIKQNVSVMFKEFEIYDELGNLSGEANEKMSAAMRIEVTGDSDTVDYTIKKSFMSVGSKVTVNRENVDSSVSALDALWVAVIASEVEDSEKKK